jgi:hypothetical protein
MVFEKNLPREKIMDLCCGFDGAGGVSIGPLEPPVD